MGYMHIIKPDGTVVSLQRDEVPSNKELGAIVGGVPESVRVLYDLRYTTMYVDEFGAVADREGGQREPNPRATAIYWQNSVVALARGHFTPGSFGRVGNPLTAPMIHGTAVLIDGIPEPEDRI